MTKIGFDLDGVLYDWHRVIYEWMKDNQSGFDVSYSEFWLDWIQTEERKKLANFLCKTPIFVTKLIMSESIREMLWSLALENELFYITSRPKEVRLSTEWWIKTSRIPNPENLIFADGSKLPHVIDNDINFFIEDMTKHALELRDHTQVVLVAKPWNTIIQDEFPTIYNVIQLPELLEEMMYEVSINIKD